MSISLSSKDIIANHLIHLYFYVLNYIVRFQTPPLQEKLNTKQWEFHKMLKVEKLFKNSKLKFLLFSKVFSHSFQIYVT